MTSILDRAASDTSPAQARSSRPRNACRRSLSADARMEPFITRYGLLAVFLGVAFEGDVGVILSGVVAHMHLLHFSLVGAVGAVRW